MKRNLSILGILVAMFLVVLSQSRGVSGFHASNSSDEREAETKIQAVLSKMVTSHKTYLSVPFKTARRYGYSLKRKEQRMWSRSALPPGIRSMALLGTTED